jgi:hypothetical protein
LKWVSRVEITSHFELGETRFETPPRLPARVRQRYNEAMPTWKIAVLALSVLLGSAGTAYAAYQHFGCACGEACPCGAACDCE